MENTNELIPAKQHRGLTGIPELCLYTGSQFVGEKKWLKARQHFEVEFKYVDRDNDILSGIFTVKGVNGNLIHKQTYFEGEIIGPKHSFQTRKWWANMEVDKKSWSKFESFRKFGNTFLKDRFDHDAIKGMDTIYMRWKERPSRGNIGFPSPGFFYTCLTKSEGVIEGVYYERNVEDWNNETITLKYVPQRSFPVLEFR